MIVKSVQIISQHRIFYLSAVRLHFQNAIGKSFYAFILYSPSMSNTFYSVIFVHHIPCLSVIHSLCVIMLHQLYFIVICKYVHAAYMYASVLLYCICIKNLVLCIKLNLN